MTILFIILGAILMAVNIVRYLKFIKTTQDVISSGSRRDRIWTYLALVLLLFFLLGYLFIAFFSQPDFIMSMVLFWGSVFVAIVLTLIFNLLDTAKTRSIDIAEVLIGVIDARDPNLKGHSRQVQEVTMMLFDAMPNAMKKDINAVSLQYASLMHDVGKLGIPEAILNKPAKLTPEEWVIMKKHPKLGVELLKSLNSFDEISDWILYHHERMDGKGYYGLSEEEIPFPSKIISVADTYSAITMRRSYKEARSHETAIEIIKDVAGSQLDAQVVEVLLSLPQEALMETIPEFDS
ncbi:MAG: HD-GYP domain-containing protein [Eubacterium sp.]|nr:HD-GYP domain-containing protein [Eubacterium sp.]